MSESIRLDIFHNYYDSNYESHAFVYEFAMVFITLTTF
jgi:hypothetical protein